MQSPSGGIYRDSMSRCEAYDLYSVIRNPTAPPPRLPKDTLEVLQTDQGKLEQQALGRLKTNILQLPNENLVVVARVGKFVFFAAAIPPYMILYAIPKWLVIVAMPYLLDHLKNVGIRFSNLFGNASTFLASQFRTLLSIKSAFMSAFQKVGEYLSWINALSSALFTYMQNRGQAFFNSVSGPFNQFFGMLMATQAWMGSKWGTLAGKIAVLANAISEIAAKVGKWMAVPFNFERAVISERFTELSKAFLNRLSGFSEKYLQMKDRAFENISTGITRTIQAAYIAMQGWISPLFSWVQPAAERIYAANRIFAEGVNRVLEKAQRFFKDYAERAAKGFENAARAVQEAAITPVINLFINYPKQKFKDIKNSSEQYFRRFRQRSKKVKERIQHRIRQTLKTVGFQMTKQGSQLFEFIMRYLAKAARFIAIQMQKAPAQLFGLLARCFKILKSTVQKIIKSVYLTLLYTFILCRYFGYLMSELWAEIPQMIDFIPKKK